MPGLLKSCCRSIFMRSLFLAPLLVLMVFAFATAVAAANEEVRTESTSSEPNAPQISDRVLYAPGHFGNSYEVMGQREMRAMIDEAKHWGFNRYADWFDTIDCADPSANSGFRLANAIWKRKKENFLSAQAAGMKCDMVLTPNHVFLDQCLPKVRAKMGGSVFGQLVCPSIPEGREIILKNYERWFSDLAKSGVRLSAICPAPYDYGGCNCKQCDPWILTFAQLSKEIHTLCEKHHPGVEVHMIGWWWEKSEHEALAAWADEHAPGWIDRIYMHIPYNKTAVAEVSLPKDCALAAFVHIGYAGKTGPRDVYGHLGPVAAPERMEQTIRDLKKQGVTSIMAYSEGLFDDVNKALCAGLASQQYTTSNEILAAYAQRYFGTSEEVSNEWARWIALWEMPYDVDTVASGNRLQSLLAATPAATPTGNWRRQQLEFKQKMLHLNHQIMQHTSWTPERMELAEEFWATRERLQRQVLGLGPARHVMNVRSSTIPWLREWQSERKGE